MDKKILLLLAILGILLGLHIYGESSVAQENSIAVFPIGIMEDFPKTTSLLFRPPLKNIKIVALRGEYEPFSFLVFSKEARKDLRVAVSSLKMIGNKDSEIDLDDIEVHRLEKGKALYGVYDWLLKPSGNKAAEGGGFTRFWVTIHVPEGISAGEYAGSLSVHSEAGGSVVIPIELKALGHRLEDPGDVQFALLYTVSPFGQYFNPETYTQIKPGVLEFYKELRAHGMTCISPKTSDWPYRKGNIEGLKAEVCLAMEAGLRGPVLWYMSALINGAKGGKKYAHYDGKCDNWDEEPDLQNLREIVTITKENEKKQGWPEVIFIPVDEPGTLTEDWHLRNLRMEILKKSLEVVSDMGPRAATTVSDLVDDPHNKTPHSSKPNELRKFWSQVRPYCPIRIYAYGYPQGETNLYHERENAERLNHEIWFYFNDAILSKNRFKARTYFGIWGWKVKADGLTAWTYPGARTVQWEIVREGIDDLKYLKLIERLLQKTPVDPDVRKTAEAFLNDVSESVDLNENGFADDFKPKIVPVIFRKHALEIIERLPHA